jgi:hypothetical protein
MLLKVKVKNYQVMRIIKTLNLKKATVQLAVFFLAFAACQPDNEILSSIDTQNVNSESASEALISENSDIATKVISAMTNTQYAGARFSAEVLALSDSRLNGAIVTLYRTGTKDAPAGQIIIDYATGSTDNHGVIRKGKIKITYEGKRWMPGSSYKIELKDFYRNSAHIEGTQHTDFTGLGPSNDTLQLKFDTNLDSGKITFGDGRTIQRKDTLKKIWYRFVDLTTGKIDPLRGELHVTGSGWGKNKLGNSYEWEITSELVYSLSCWISNKVYIPVKGEKSLTVNNVTYAVAYGKGECDNQITVKLSNGKQKAINITSDGN